MIVRKYNVNFRKYDNCFIISNKKRAITFPIDKGGVTFRLAFPNRIEVEGEFFCENVLTCPKSFDKMIKSLTNDANEFFEN